eukprot:g26625.t1
MIQRVKRRRLDRLARRESHLLPSVVWQLITDYLYRREDVAALRKLCGAKPDVVRSWTLSRLYTLSANTSAPRPQPGIAEVIIEESSTKFKEIWPLKSLQEQLGLQYICSLVVSAEATSFGFCANLCPGARGPLDPPTCLLVHLSIEAGHEAMLSQACEFLSRATFPRLETLRLAYTGRTSAALESRLPTLGLQRSRLPRLKLMFLGPLPTSITGTILAATEVVFTGAVGSGSCLDRL